MHKVSLGKQQLLQEMIYSVVLLWFITCCAASGKMWLPMNLQFVLHYLSDASMRFGKIVYTGHALLVHELLNFIVPSPSSCNLTLCVSQLIHLSLPFRHLPARSLVLYCSHSSKWALQPSRFIYVWTLMISAERMARLIVWVTYHT